VNPEYSGDSEVMATNSNFYKINDIGLMLKRFIDKSCKMHYKTLSKISKDCHPEHVSGSIIVKCWTLLDADPETSGQHEIICQSFDALII